MLVICLLASCWGKWNICKEGKLFLLWSQLSMNRGKKCRTKLALKVKMQIAGAQIRRLLWKQITDTQAPESLFFRSPLELHIMYFNLGRKWKTSFPDLQIQGKPKGILAIIWWVRMEICLLKFVSILTH